MAYLPIQQWDKRKTRLSKNGYVLVWIPEHPRSFKQGWYFEHILVAEKMLGRLLEHYESVHHISQNKQDNTWKNLFVCTREEHDRAHRMQGVSYRKLHPTWTCRTCTICGIVFWGSPQIIARRRRCSASCKSRQASND